MKEIELSQSKVALVSDEDYEYLMQWKWKYVSSGSKKTGYAVRYVYEGVVDGKTKNKTVMMHREVAKRMNLDLTHLIDHRDRNGLNNSRENLRSATNKQNQENCTFRNNTSGHRGVSWCKKRRKWSAKIQHNKVRYSLGYYENKDDAVKARKEAEKKYYTHSIPCG